MSDLFGAVASFFGAVAQTAGDTAKAVVDTAETVVNDVTGGSAGKAGNDVVHAVEGVGQIVAGVVEGVGGAAAAIVTGDVRAAGDAIGVIADGAAFYANLGAGAAQAVADTLDGHGDPVGDLLNGLNRATADSPDGHILDGVNAIGAAVSQAGQAIANGVGVVAAGAKEAGAAIGSLAGDVASAVSHGAAVVGTVVGDVASGVGKASGDVLSADLRGVGDVLSGVVRAGADAASGILHGDADVANGLANVLDGRGSLQTAVSQAGAALNTGLEHAGQALADGFAHGSAAVDAGGKAAAIDIAQGLAKAVQDTGGHLPQIGPDPLPPDLAALAQSATAAGKAAGDAAGHFVAGVAQALGDLFAPSSNGPLHPIGQDGRAIGTGGSEKAQALGALPEQPSGADSLGPISVHVPVGQQSLAHPITPAEDPVFHTGQEGLRGVGNVLTLLANTASQPVVHNASGIAVDVSGLGHTIPTSGLTAALSGTHPIGDLPPPSHGGGVIDPPPPQVADHHVASHSIDVSPIHLDHAQVSSVAAVHFDAFHH